MPPAPHLLSEREREVWARLAVEVDAAGVYTRADWSAFHLWARSAALLERAMAGEALDTDREGTPRAVPVSSINALIRTVASLAARFRCDPASRGAVAAPVEPEGDDPDAFEPLPAEVVPLRKAH